VLVGTTSVIVASSTNGFVRSYDARTGTLRWEHRIPGQVVESTPLLAADGKLYVFFGGTTLAALDSKTGSVYFSFDITFGGSVVQSSPSLNSNGVLFVGTASSGVAAIWGGLLNRQPFACPATCVSSGWLQQGRGGDRSGYAPFAGPRVGSLGIRWTSGVISTTGHPNVYGSPVIGSDNTIYAISGSGRVVALEGETGNVIWSASTGASVSTTPALTFNNYLIVGNDDGIVSAFDTGNGVRQWRFDMGGSIVSSVGVDGVRVYVPVKEGVVAALSVLDGALMWAFRTIDTVEGAGIIRSPVTLTRTNSLIFTVRLVHEGLCEVEYV
jgi:outer membrane protein assembly factor BamB